MKRVILRQDEWFPVYTFGLLEEGEKTELPVIEMPDDIYEEYEALMRLFDLVQDRLEKAYLSWTPKG